MAPMIWNMRRPDGVLRSRLSRKLQQERVHLMLELNDINDEMKRLQNIEVADKLDYHLTESLSTDD